MRWGRVFGYAAILILVTHALSLLVGHLIAWENSPIEVNSAIELIVVLLLPAIVTFLLVGAASIAVFGVLTYRSSEKAVACVILVALLTWLLSLPINVLFPWRPWVLDIVLWMAGGLFTVSWAGIGLNVGARLRASRARLPAFP